MKRHLATFKFLIPAILILVIGLGGWYLDTWAWLSGSDYRPNANDLRQITATATCIQADPSWDIVGPACDASGRAYNYPSIWARGFAVLGLGEPNTRALGAVMALILLVTVSTLAYMIRDCLSDRRCLTLFTIAALAPPIWLALDRANTDIIIFAFLVAAALFTYRGRVAASTITIAMAILLKIFAIGAVIAVLGDPRRSRWTLVLLVVLLALTALVLSGEVALISSRTPRTDHLSFGVSTIPIRYQSLLGTFAGNGRVIGSIAMVLFAAGLLASLLILRVPSLNSHFQALLDAATDSRRSWGMLTIGIGTTLVAYLVGTSYDYRLIFLLLIVAGLLSTWKAAPGPSSTAAMAAVAIMIMSGPWLVLGAIADLLLLLLAPASGIFLWHLTIRLRRIGRQQGDLKSTNRLLLTRPITTVEPPPPRPEQTQPT